VSFALIALCSFSAAQGTGKVRLSVHPAKATYRLDEPIYLVIDLFNSSGQTRSIPSGCCTYEVAVSGPGIPEVDRSKEVKVCDCPGGFLKLQPGEHYRELLLLNAEPGAENPHAAWLTEHYRMTQAGSYTVKMNRSLIDTWVSAETKVHVAAVFSR
jgi:hypothetical protein